MQILYKKNILGGSVLHILQIHNFVIWLQMLLKNVLLNVMYKGEISYIILKEKAHTQQNFSRNYL